ncbi:FAD:protein FMN transferase [Candidatus Neomarinimicrobiota bacterium]
MTIVNHVEDLFPGTHRFSHEAMATTFEILILHQDADYAHQAAWEAFKEIDRLELQLSRFIENSDISRINSQAPWQPLKIGLAAFECLQLSTQLSTETGGAFDANVGFLMDCWLNKDKSARIPSKEELAAAVVLTGMHLLELDEAGHTVELTSPVSLDFGGVGKGYAVDRVAELLFDWSIDTALIHGGASSVLALGSPPGVDGWPLTMSRPGLNRQVLARVHLKDRALSGSGLEKGQHIIDPRTGHPVESIIAAWASTPKAAVADALSTAFMAMTPESVGNYCSKHPEALVMIVLDGQHGEGPGDDILRFGPWEQETHLKYIDSTQPNIR